MNSVKMNVVGIAIIGIIHMVAGGQIKPKSEIIILEDTFPKLYCLKFTFATPPEWLKKPYCGSRAWANNNKPVRLYDQGPFVMKNYDVSTATGSFEFLTYGFVNYATKNLHIEIGCGTKNWEENIHVIYPDPALTAGWTKKRYINATDIRNEIAHINSQMFTLNEVANRTAPFISPTITEKISVRDSINITTIILSLFSIILALSKIVGGKKR